MTAARVTTIGADPTDMLLFLDHILEQCVETVDGCWIFLGAWQRGYGRVSLPGNGPRIFTHRLAYEVMVGPIPGGLEIDHLCLRRQCMNPAHLEPVTGPVNNHRRDMARRVLRPRQPKDVCHNGHPYGDNPLINSDGSRRCRVCKESWREAANARRRAARAAAKAHATAAAGAPPSPAAVA